VIALGRWAAASPVRGPDAPIGAGALVLALRALFEPSSAEGLDAVLELRLGEDRFRVEVGNGVLVVARADGERPDAIIATDPETLRAVLWHGRPLAEARGSGDLTIEGDAHAAERFTLLFPLREPAVAG